MIGPAGSGKTSTQVWAAEAKIREGGNVKLMWIAPYNSQVDALKAKLRGLAHLWIALRRGRSVRTAASVFGFPKWGKLDAAKMEKKMNAADKEVLRSENLVLLIDEADLLSPGNRDAISEVLKILREDSRPNGGAQNFSTSFY